MNESIFLETGAVILFYNYDDPDYESDEIFQQLLKTISWKQPTVKMYGKTFLPKRKVSTMGKPYNYNGNHSREETIIPEIVQKIMDKINSITQKEYNTCIANYYENGEAYISMHDDGEKSSESIATLSFGATRQFVVQNKFNKTKHKILLEDKSIIIMEGKEFQKNWKHGIPQEKKITQPRISLTFRKY